MQCAMIRLKSNEISVKYMVRSTKIKTCTQLFGVNDPRADLRGQSLRLLVTHELILQALKFNIIKKQPYYVFCVKRTCKYLQSFLEGVHDRLPFNAKIKVMVKASQFICKILFKTVSTEHSQQLNIFNLKYLGTVETIFLATTLQYELA